MREPQWYHIRITGHLDPQWVDCFENVTLAPNADGTTTLRAAVADPTALYGLLGKLRDLGVRLIAVLPLEPPASDEE